MILLFLIQYLSHRANMNKTFIYFFLLKISGKLFVTDEFVAPYNAFLEPMCKERTYYMRIDNGSL